MLKTFPIDFVRQTLDQKLFEEHLKDINLYGGKDQVSILSFYEQLRSQDEVDRFVETFRDLSEQQNRTGLIMNGVLTSPDNPTITNLYSSLIVPMTWTCSFRVLLANRDDAITSINNLIEKLKGRKVDIAQLKCVDENNNVIGYQPFVVGTIGQHVDGLTLKDGDYIGETSSSNLDTGVATLLNSLASKGFPITFAQPIYLYVGFENKIRAIKVTYTSPSTYTYELLYGNDTYEKIIIPPEHNSFEKYKLSLSFDAIRCDEPRNLNAEEYCELTFSGSATLVSNGVKLGNDLIKISLQKSKIVAESDITFTSATTYWLEPLEMPSGNNANTQINQLVSNNFLTNTHTDAIALTLQYTFICDDSNDLLKQLFRYARYGTRGITASEISPNMIFNNGEVWCSWGAFEYNVVETKLVENIDIENTESDTLTITIPFQVQGENN